MKHIKNWKAVNAAISKYYENNKSEYVQNNKMYWMERLAAADQAPLLTQIMADVRWGRGSEGLVAKATVTVEMEDENGLSCGYGHGRAAGGGYDKASAAVNEALAFEPRRADSKAARETKKRALASIDRFVIEHGEKLWEKYAIDRTPFPHFCFAGKGMGTITNLFRRIGVKYSNGAVCKDYLIYFDESGRNEDHYHIIHKDYI